MARANTRAAQGSGTIRQRKDGRWEARYTVGRDPGTGKQIQRSIYGATQAEVRKKLQQVSVDLDNGVYVEPSKMTVGQWLDIWLKDYNKEVKPRTLALYEGSVNHRIKPSLGMIKLSALRPHNIQSFLNQLGQATADKPALSPKSIKNLFGVLHKALVQARELGYIKLNPSDACKLPRIEKPDIKPLDSTQISAFITAIKGHPYEIFYIVDLFTGLRQCELIGLTWDCLEGNTLYVYRQLQLLNGAYRFIEVKNSKPRRITLAPAIIRLLQEQKRKQAEAQLLAGSLWSNKENFIFTNEFGRHLATKTVYFNLKRIFADIGLPSNRFHDLRHSYAVAALQSGDDIKTVQENLGHHSAAFTLDVYGHVTEKMKQESAARMEGFIQSVAKL